MRLAQYRQFPYGMNSYVEDSLAIPGQLKKAKNVRPYKIGQLRRRNGSSLFRSQISAGNEVDGLFFFDSRTPAYEQFIAKVNTKSYYDSTGWTEKETGLTDGEIYRYASFVDRVFRTNPTDGIKSWDGNTANAWGATQLTNATAGKFIKVFQEKLHVATSANVYFSGVPDLSNNIAWDTEDYFPVAPDDGAEIRGMEVVRNRMLFWKDNGIYTYNGYALDRISQKGTTKEESVSANDELAFFYRDNCALKKQGIYVVDGTSVIQLTRRIHDYVEGVTTTGRMPGIFTGSSYLIFVGDTNSETNVIFEYDVDADEVFIHTVPYDVTVWAMKDDEVYLGTTDGKVILWDDSSVNRDESTNIAMEVESLGMFGTDVDYMTQFNELHARLSGGANASIAYSIDGGSYTTPVSLAATYKRLVVNKTGRMFQWKITHSTNEAAPVLKSVIVMAEDLGDQHA